MMSKKGKMLTLSRNVLHSTLLKVEKSNLYSLVENFLHHTSVDQTKQRDVNVTQDFHSILSDENKKRSQSKLTKVDPIRTWNDYHLKPDHKYAAVLVPLCVVAGEPSLLFTLRSSRLKSHRGQVSFPGGNVDKTDTDFVHTALRETEEELGLNPSTFDIWGEMNPLPGSGGRNVVYPVLANAGNLRLSSLCINKDEVEEAFAVSLNHLCDHKNAGSTRFRDGNEYTLPVYLNSAHRIWGLTAVIIHQTLNIIAPELYTYKVKHVRSHHHDHKRKHSKQRR